MNHSDARLERAADEFRTILFGPRVGLDDLGFVGVGTDKLHVYIYAKTWPHQEVRTYDGIDVEYHLGVGKIRAQPARE